jgi:hypothetical protein
MFADREAKACVVEADECSDAREVEAARIEKAKF